LKTITVTSGKGGVGKTNLSVNIAVSLASQGYKTCLFDADIGLANVNILMGLAASDTLEDVISGKKELKEIIIKNWNKIDIIPGSSGVEQFESLDSKALDRLLNQFSKLEGYDYIIVDTGAGISKSVVSFCLASSLLVLAVVPEPTSLTDAYSLLKVLRFNGYKNSVSIVVNRCKTLKLGEKVFEKFKQTVTKYISLNLKYLGTVPEDEKVSDSVSGQSPFLIKYPNSPASKSIEKITEEILKTKHESSNEIKSFDSFIKTCSNFFQTRLKLVKQPEEKKQVQVKKEPPVKTQDQAPLAVEEKNPENQSLEILKTLAKNTDKIAKELGIIKEILLNTKSQPESFYSSPAENDEKEDYEPPVLTLDFEKFVNKNK
jgi:flagellar biosynthesis protein FlhG